MTTPQSRKDEEKQSWAEAVIECVSDSAERERLIRLYDYDELVKACLALGTLALSAKHESARNKQLEAALSEMVPKAELDAARRAMSDGALHAWAMCEKARADAFKECAEIVEGMSGVEEGRSDHATSDAAWAAIKLQDAAEKIRQRAAKTNHVTHALVKK